jgi:hypothetical protein
MTVVAAALLMGQILCAAAGSPGPARYGGKTAEEWLAGLRRQRDGFVAGKIPPLQDPHRALVALGREAVPALEVELGRSDDRQVLGILEEIGEPAVPALCKLLEPNRDAAFRLEVLHVLAQLGPKARTAVPTLLQCLADTDSSTTVGGRELKLYPYAERALGRIDRPGKGSLGVLTEALGDAKHPLKRRWAAILLGRLGPDAREAVPALTKAVDSGPDKLRTCAIQALGRVGGAEAAKVLAARLPKLPEDNASLIEALGETREASALRTLVGVIRRNPYRPVMGRAILKFGRAALEPLLPLLRDKDRRTRERAAWAIGALGAHGAPAVEPLRALLKDDHEAVRCAAAVSLGEIGPAAAPAVPDLIRLIDEGNAAIGAFRGIGPKARAAVPALIRVLRDKKREWVDRDLAAQSLGRIGAPAESAIPHLEAVIGEYPNPDSCVRQACQQAIRRIRKALGQVAPPAPDGAEIPPGR